MQNSGETRRGKVKVCAQSFRGDAKHRTTMRNCASENLEIPGLVRSLSSGGAKRRPVGTIPE